MEYTSILIDGMNVYAFDLFTQIFFRGITT